jgi:hypothetical protein
VNREVSDKWYEGRDRERQRREIDREIIVSDPVLHSEVGIILLAFSTYLSTAPSAS